MNACGMRDGLSGDMLVLSQRNLVIQGYVHPLRHSNLTEALHTLTQKQAIELVKNQATLAFFNRLFFASKPNKWRPILDLCFLKKSKKIQSGDTRKNNNFLANRRMTGHEVPTFFLFFEKFLFIPISRKFPIFSYFW